MQSEPSPTSRFSGILRPATMADVPELARLGRDSFLAKFGHLYSASDREFFVSEVYSEATVAEEIEDPELLHCLSADSANGALTGYAKLRQPSWYAEHSNAKNPVALGQLYTAPDRTGEGIGAALMAWALDEANRRGCDAMQLSVFSENEGAQRFYQRYGFAKIADIDFWVGTHRDAEFLYELNLADQTSRPSIAVPASAARPG